MTDNVLGSIVHEYRRAQGNNHKVLSLRGFASRLCKPVEILRLSISYETIRAWEGGTSVPKDEFLHALTIFTEPQSWQWKFAQDCKAAIYPSIHEPVGEIGKRVLLGESVHDEKATVAAG